MMRLAALGAIAPTMPAAAAWAPADKAKTGMIVRSTRPEDLEMMPDGFTQDITPIERFFVRSHHYTPKVDLSQWKLEINGDVSTPQSFNFEQIQKLPKVELVSVLECAGNGRGLYEPSMPGLQWEWGAVGNARWAGVRLSDVLKLAGVSSTAKEVVFDGADVPVGKMPEFQRSIPLAKAMQPEVMLAFQMNGEPLPTSHGFPLRLIVPGWAGDCWVKWLTRITVSSTEFDGFFMKTAYRHPGKVVRPGTSVDPAKMRPVTELSVKSAIGYPLDGTQIDMGAEIVIKGVAWTGTSRVNTVHVSTDGGANWNPARPGAYHGEFSWRSWSYNFTPNQDGFAQIMVRAGDEGGGRQPYAQPWNPSGYSWNVPHTIGVEVISSRDQQTPAAAPAGPAPAAQKLPPVYQQNCLACHEENVISQQRLTRAQWDREIDKMVRWGAKVKPADKESLLNYLANRFPYRFRK